MTTGATGQLGLALPVQGELSGTWGDTVNNGITQYTNIAIAGTLTLTGDGAVTLANTTGDASASNITSTLTGAGTVTAQFAIVRVTGTLTVAKVVTAPSYSKTYTVVNAATGGIVTFKASGQTGVSVAVGESAFVYFNGTDYVKLVGTATAGAAGGSNTQVQFNSSGVLAGSSSLTWDGTTLSSTQVNITGQGTLRLQDTTGGEYVGLRSPSALGASYTLTFPADDGTSGQALITDGSGVLSWSTAASGDVYGPGSSTDNAVARFDSTTGKLLQNSVVIVGDTGDVSGVGTLSAATLTLTNALGTAYGGTGLTSFTSGGVVYASSTSALATGSTLTFSSNIFKVTNASGYSTTTLSGSSGTGGILSFVDSASVTTQRIVGFGSTAGENTSLRFDTNGAERMRIDGSGSIGIGSTATNPAGYSIGVNLNGASNVGYQVSVAGTLVGAFSGYAGETRISSQSTNPMTFYINASEQMRLTSTGLGIGTSSPAFKLSVAGDILSPETASSTSYKIGNADKSNQFISAKRGSLTLQASSGLSGSQGISGQDLIVTAGNSYFSSAGVEGDLYLKAGYNTLGATSASVLFYTTNAERMRLDASGNLGLGVTPSASSGVRAFEILNAGNGLLNGAASQMIVTANTYFNSAYKYASTNAASYYSQFNGVHSWYQAASGTAGTNISFTQAMTLDASGRLGIGTTSPAKQLHIESATGGTIRLSSSDTSVGVGESLGEIDWYSNDASGSGTGVRAFINVVENDGLGRSYDMTFGTGSSATATEKMRITKDGNVGIGTTSPLELLSLYKASNPYIVLQNSATGTTSSDGGYVGMDGSTMQVRNKESEALSFWTDNTEKARIDSSGNFLIGTTSSGSLPGDGYVFIKSTSTQYIGHASGTSSGTGYMQFWYAGGSIGSITQSGTTAVLYNLTSDQRLKENIQDAESSSNLIDAIQVRQFDWKSDGSHTRYGFIAQELVTVAPEAVHQPTDTEEMMAVDYSKLVPMLVKEIQSLRARVAQLER